LALMQKPPLISPLKSAAERKPEPKPKLPKMRKPRPKPKRLPLRR
jgi:hypothetical protein